jgi:alpha-tubulin suppressor-like RCC1 family protein
LAIFCSLIEPLFLRLLSESGAFYGVGLNKFGILGSQAGTEAIVPKFSKLWSEEESLKFFSSNNPVVDFACGWNHVLVLLKDGRILSWGRNNFSQLGRPPKPFSDFDTMPDYVQGLPEPIVSIACGSEHNLALGDSGLIYCWGWNEHENCGVPLKSSILNHVEETDAHHVIHVPTNVPIPDTERVVGIGCGAGNCFAITKPRK